MNIKTPPAPIKEITAEEMIPWFNESYQALRDCVVVKIPTDSELEKLSKTKSGIYTSLKDSKEEYVYTILATGPKCEGITPGDKVIIGAGNIPSFIVNGYAVGQINQYQVIGKVK